MWNSFGSLPEPNEIEVTVLGPGYGESVVVHLGNGEWLVVDSCVDTLEPDKPSAPLLYLRRLGVRVEQAVKIIVLSHWDDDHVRGIAELLEACPNASFVTSKALSNEKFTCFVEAMSVGAKKTDGANVANIRRVLELLVERDKPIIGAAPARMLCSKPIVRCWSPSDADQDEFLVYVAGLDPRHGECLRKAYPRAPNLTSVVITIDWPENSVLLGADMETSSDGKRGWGAIIAEAQQIGFDPADLVKVPHHGSSNGHHDGMWDVLLDKEPIATVTPFGRGPLTRRPPKSSDLRRIAKKSGKLFVSARHEMASRAKMDFSVARSLREGDISLISHKAAMGIVRHRKKPDSDWLHELFGTAYRIK